MKDLEKQALLTKLREGVENYEDKELTGIELFMRNMPTSFCGCSYSKRCEEHKDIPLPERTFTKSEVLALIEKGGE